MQRIRALARALDSFGFDEQAASCTRLLESGSIAFKDESLQWQQWAVDVDSKSEESVSLDEYDSWTRSRDAALKAFDDLALPPPLMFDLLDPSAPAVGNSLTKARSIATRILYSAALFATQGFNEQPLNPSDRKVIETIQQHLADSLSLSATYIEACKVACSVSRTCDPSIDTWPHSLWSHGVSHVSWILRMLKVFAPGDSTLSPEQNSQETLDAIAVWVADHFEFVLAVVESEVNLTPNESGTCDMIRDLMRRCSHDSIAAAASALCMSRLFEAIGPKLKDPLTSSIPYPINSLFVRALISRLFPNPSVTTDGDLSFEEFSKAIHSSRSVFGVSQLTLNSIFTTQAIVCASKSPSIASMQKLTAMVPATSSTSYSVLADVSVPEWEQKLQSSTRETAAGVLLTLIANFRNVLVAPAENIEASVDLIQEVLRALCAWSPASPADLWLQIAAAIEEAQVRFLDNKIANEGWEAAATAASTSVSRRGTVFKTITFGAGSSAGKGLQMHVSNLQELVECEKIDVSCISAFVDFVSKEAAVDMNVFSPVIVEIAMPNASFDEKTKAARVASRALFFCVTHLCLGPLVDSVGHAGVIDNDMVAGCVALESFEELFVKKDIIDASEGKIRVQLETVLEKTKRQVTIKFNALFEEIVKIETFSNLSQVDGSSSSSTDMCSLLINLTKHFVSAKVPIGHRWWGVPTHVMMSIIDRYIEFNAATGSIPSPVLPKVVHKSGMLSMFKSSDDKVVVPRGRRASQYEFREEDIAKLDGTTLWGPKAEHTRLSEQRMEELVARYCNMEKVAEFLTSLESDWRIESDDYDKQPMAIDLGQLLERVQSKKKIVLSYLSHKIVLFDLYEPLCDRLFAPDPSQKNPTARPFRITPLLTEFVDPLLSKLASILPPMYAMAIFKAVYAAVLVAFDRSIFNGGEHKCLDKFDIIIGDLDEIKAYFAEGLKSAYNEQQIEHALGTPHFRWLKSACDLFAASSSELIQMYKEGTAVESSPSDTNPRVSYFIFRVIMSKKDKADKAADDFRSKVMGMGGKAMRDVAKALKRPPGTVFW